MISLNLKNYAFFFFLEREAHCGLSNINALIMVWGMLKLRASYGYFVVVNESKKIYKVIYRNLLGRDEKHYIHNECEAVCIVLTLSEGWGF